MLRIALCLFLATTVTCHQYSPLCQNWCCGQQAVGYPQMCNSYCGGCGPCTSGYPYPYPYPQNPSYPGIGPSFPSYPIGPSYPINPSFPGPPTLWPGFPSNPGLPTGTNPIKVVVSTKQEWICPTDPQPRAGEIPGSLPSKLIACEYDEECTNSPVRQLCCLDQGVNDKVCKPAILV